MREHRRDLHVAEQALTVEFINPWKLVADFNSTPVPTLAACGENQGIERWRCLSDKVRTFFEENPSG
jgi:hypothetical protein